MKASLFTPLAAVDTTLQLLGIRATTPKNVVLPKSVLDTYIGQLIIAAGVGTPWVIAPGVPLAGAGYVGNYYLNSSTGDIYGPKTAGGWGVIKANIKGPAGTGNGGDTDGTLIHSGAGAPTDGVTVGNDGDYYLDTETGNFYGPFALETYGSVLFSLMGSNGTNGANWLLGADVPADSLGTNGDLYLNGANGDVYGPKTAGVWGVSSYSLLGRTPEFLVGAALQPSVGDGANGDFYLSNVSGQLFGPKSAGVWSSTPIFNMMGTTGLAGANWLTDSAAPVAGTGVNGDLFLNLTTGDVYGPKAAGVWGPIVYNLKGLPGTNGTNGTLWLVDTGAPEVGDGIDGNVYLDTDTGDLYGPKTAGVWGSVVTNLKGQDGFGLAQQFQVPVIDPTYTQLPGQTNLTINADCVVTLVDPTTVPGQLLFVRSYNENVTVSSSDINVLSTAGDLTNVILAGHEEIGSYVLLQANGSAWEVLFVSVLGNGLTVDANGSVSVTFKDTTYFTAVDVTTDDDATFSGVMISNVLLASRNYRIKGQILFDAGNTANSLKIKLGGGGPQNGSGVVAGRFQAVSDAGVLLVKSVSGFDAEVSFLTSELVGTKNLMTFEFYFKPAEDSPISIEATTVTDGTSVTIFAGSSMTITDDNTTP